MTKILILVDIIFLYVFKFIIKEQNFIAKLLLDTLNAEITFEDVRKTKYSLDTIVECDNQCTESSDCATIPIGAKPCGGPSGYLIYSKSSVYSNYIQKLALFITELEKIYNEQHAIISNCMVTPMRGASCHRNRCI